MESSDKPEMTNSLRSNDLHSTFSRRALIRRWLATSVGGVSIAGCQGSDTNRGEDSSAESSIMLTDAIGRRVTVSQPAERIVAIGPGVLRQVSYLGAADRVVGVERGEQNSHRILPYNIANPQFQDLPVIGASGPNATGNLESILSLSPDLIIISAVSGAESADQIATKTGVSTLVLPMPFPTPDRPHQVFFKSWQMLGRALGVSDRANKLIDIVNSHVSSIRSRVPEQPDGSAYAGGVSFKGAQGVTATWAPYPPFQYSGVENVAKNINSDTVSITVSPEQLLAWDPSHVFVNAQNMRIIKKDLQQHPVVERTTAFRNGDIYTLLPVAFYHINIGSMLANAYFVGSTLYPEAFTDVNTASSANRIYDDLLGAEVYSRISEQTNSYHTPNINV